MRWTIHVYFTSKTPFLVMFDNRCAYKRCLTPVFAWCLRRPMTGNPSKLDFFKRPFVSGVIHTIFRVC